MHAIATLPDFPVRLDQYAQMDPLEFAAKGFLASYRGRTFEAYSLDLRSFFGWCHSQDLHPLHVLRPHLEAFILWMETDKGYMSATINRRFNTVALFYKYATDEDVILKDPAAKVKRPKIDEEGQKRTYLTPLEHGVFLAAARKMGVMPNCLATLLAVRGLRISEATSLDVTDITNIGGYDHVTFIGKGGDQATVPLPVPAMRAVRAAIGERTEGPLLLNLWGNRMDRAAATRLIRKIAETAKVNTDISPHSLRRSFATTGIAMGVPLRDMQLSLRHKSPNTTAIYDRRSTNPDRDAAHRVAGYLAGMAG